MAHCERSGAMSPRAAAPEIAASQLPCSENNEEGDRMGVTASAGMRMLEWLVRSRARRGRASY